jgi:hypothetical protein
MGPLGVVVRLHVSLLHHPSGRLSIDISLHKQDGVIGLAICTNIENLSRISVEDLANFVNRDYFSDSREADPVVWPGLLLVVFKGVHTIII